MEATKNETEKIILLKEIEQITQEQNTTEQKDQEEKKEAEKKKELVEKKEKEAAAAEGGDKKADAKGDAKPAKPEGVGAPAPFIPPELAGGAPPA